MFNDNNKTRKLDAYLRPHQPSAMKLLVKINIKMLTVNYFHKKTFPNLSVFHPNAGKYRPE